MLTSNQLFFVPAVYPTFPSRLCFPDYGLAQRIVTFTAYSYKKRQLAFSSACDRCHGDACVTMAMHRGSMKEEHGGSEPHRERSAPAILCMLWACVSRHRAGPVGFKPLMITELPNFIHPTHKHQQGPLVAEIK